MPFANAHCRLTAAGALWARSKGSPPAESVIVSEPDFPIGGLRVDEDEGDPWGTRKIPAFRRSLAPFTRFLGARQFEGYAEAYYGGVYEPNLPFGNEQDPAIFALEWQITVRLLAAAARVDFEYEVFWKTANRRVRGVFPVQAGTDTGWYSIPGGWLARPRYDQTETKLWSANGDWPALYFAAAQGATATSGGWAVANYGTPANRIEDGRIVVSFLRSPGFGHCLERYAQNYPMPTSGIRDPGWHHFTLSLLPHAGHDDLPRLAQTAAALNARPFTLANGPATLPNRSWLELESATVELVACKPAFQPLPAGVPAHAVVLRLVNLADAAGCATLRFADVAPITLQECNLLEDPTGLTCSVPAGQAAEFSFTPFQVRTFLASSACSGQTPASEPAVRSRSDH